MTTGTPPPQGVAPESFSSFGTLLLFLRRRARMRQRDLAIAVGYSEAQIGRLENDQRLPDVAMVKAQFIPALELEDDPAFAQRLIALAEVVRESAPDAPAPPTAPPETHRPVLYFDADLPRAPAALFGREAELTQITALLAHPQHRCITLLGPGGVGKTRLALEVVQRAGGNYAHGTYAFALSGITSVALLEQAIAQAFGLSAARNGDVVAQICEHVGDKHMLLVLDNMEHLTDVAPLMTRLLAAPRLWLLVTSRERLHIRDEVVLEIGGLPLPEPHQARVDDAAIGLFYSAARRSPPVAASDETQAVARICRLVEGVPLGIELAAAWMHMLTVGEIEHELRQTLDFLQTNQRDLPSRHRSLRAVFEHSWALLNADEQRAIERFSVCRGSFTAQAAHVLLQNAGPLRQTLQVLAALIGKSMLKRVETHGATRYILHELVRQFAADHLRQQPEAEQFTLHTHAQFYLNILEAQHAALRGPTQHNAIAALAAEDDNIVAALRFAAEAGETALLRRVLPTLCLLLEWRNALVAGISLLETAVVAPLRLHANEPARQSALALAMAYVGWFQFHTGHHEAALTHLRQAHELASATDDCMVQGDALLFLGFVLADTGDVASGRQFIIQSIRAYEQCGDKWRLGRGLYRLGMVQHQSGYAVIARQIFAESLRQVQTVGDPRAAAFTLNRLAVIDAALGDAEAAQHLLQQSLQNATIVRDQRGMATTLYYIGVLAQQRADHGTASYFFQESCHIFTAMHEPSSVADIKAQLAFSAVERGDLHAARQWLEQAQNVLGSVEATAAAIAIVVSRAALALASGEHERGVEALALALHHPVANQASRDRATALLRRAEPHLTPYQFVAAQARGRSASFVQFARDERAVSGPERIRE